MVDLLPDQTPLWQHIEATAREHFRRAAIQEIRMPLLEVTELFARGIGEATDVVGKEMYTFLDRGERSCTLRPEGTASVVRAAIQHGLLNQGPQRLWYGGPMFRYERPQAGRQRQFHQIGVELLGTADAESDAEAIALAWDLLAELGVGGLQLELNSLGTPEDRVRYRAELVAWLEAHREQLDPDSQQRIATNPLRVLDSKNPGTQELLAGAPTLADALAGESHERFARVRLALEALEIPFVLNPRLVRGLDYYSHTAFEITSSQLGAQATVCGGGRYDGLVEQLGGAPTAAILLQGAVAALIACSGSYEAILNYVVSVDFIFYGLAGVCIFVFRRRPGSAPGFRVPGHPWTTLAFTAVCWIVVANLVRQQPLQSAIGLGILAAGLPAYGHWRRRSSP